MVRIERCRQKHRVEKVATEFRVRHKKIPCVVIHRRAWRNQSARAWVDLRDLPDPLPIRRLVRVQPIGGCDVARKFVLVIEPSEMSVEKFHDVNRHKKSRPCRIHCAAFVVSPKARRSPDRTGRESLMLRPAC